MQSKFRGALLGVLVGDCVGARYEMVQPVNSQELVLKIENIIDSESTLLNYTDDTSMTKSICKSLLADKGLNPKHLAREFTETYYNESRNRGYGASVGQVFIKLRNENYSQPYGPASKQFNGTGSYGNGAAMRCCGIALFAHKNRLDDNQTRILTENCSRITHSHRHSIHGAILLVMAIRYVLNRDDNLDEEDFLDNLVKEMISIEDPYKNFIYTEKLNHIKTVIERLSIHGQDVTQKEIVDLLGNDVSAPNSVPLAIYSFLRGISKFTDSLKFENEFLRTLHWAISCGGDTDTIAAMACALSGAYLGIDKIPEGLYKKCESWQEMISYADKLSQLITSSDKS